jgi:hypothetical protein
LATQEIDNEKTHFLLWSPNRRHCQRRICQSNASIQELGANTCISSNESPIHEIGRFPTRENPNRFKVLKVKLCFPTNLTYTGQPDERDKTIGVTLTGIPIRLGTADWYDASI